MIKTLQQYRTLFFVMVMSSLLVMVGIFQSWNVSLVILNLCIISAIMTLGINIQWGYAGLFNAGILGFVALGGLACIVISMPIVTEAWAQAGIGLLLSVILFLSTIIGAVIIQRQTKRLSYTIIVIMLGIIATRYIFDPTTDMIEKINPSKTGYVGGLGLPIIIAWFAGGAFAAIAAWLIGKITLGLRSDYLAIATLGISEIIIAIIKNEDWLTRGVKNVSGIPRPTFYELDLQESLWFQEMIIWFVGQDNNIQQYIMESSTIFVKLSFTILFTLVLIILYILCQLAHQSPWGRMVRAVRDNEIAAAAMGKNVTKIHLQLFVLGCAILGIAGAMLTSLDGQFTPNSYTPLRFTFLIWVMVIVGGSGNNIGAIIGGFFIWFIWVESEIFGVFFIDLITSWMDDDNLIRQHFMDHASFMRMIMMGIILLVTLRFFPRGLIPEK